MTIATSKPKSSEIVADIPERLLSTLYGAWFPGFLRLYEQRAFQGHKKTGTCRPGFPALLSMLLLLLYHAVIVPCLYGLDKRKELILYELMALFHRPLKRERRFSVKAVTPSRKSSVVRKKPYILPSMAMPALSGTSMDACKACFPSRQARGENASNSSTRASTRASSWSTGTTSVSRPQDLAS